MSPLVRVVRFTIVGVWAGLLIALASANLPHRGAGDSAAAPDAATAATDAAGEDVWNGIYMHDSKIGYSHYRATPEGSELRIEEMSLLRLTVLDREQTVQATITGTARGDLSLQRFEVALTSDLGIFGARGRVENGTLVLDVTTAGQTSTQRIPLDQPLYLPAAARARLMQLGVRDGQALTVQVFDAAAMQHQPMTLRVVGREALTENGVAVPTWKVRESFRGMDSEVWLDEQGHTLRERGPMGLEMRRESPADAVATGWQSTPLDLMSAVAVPVADIPDPRGRRELRLRLTGTAGVPIPSDGRQHAEGERWIIRRETLPPATYRLPYSGAQWRDELQPTMFLQSDHPQVRAAARAAAGDERDPRAAAARLRQWVHGALEQRPAATLPNALQVLQTRAGDCNEHAVLYAALARAIGLPARVVAGLVYQDGAFLYHAWNEVWLGESWVTVDAIFDQMPADVTHLKLVEGGPDTHAALVPLIGTLSIRVLPDGDAG
jgi:hypothetical protein